MVTYHVRAFPRETIQAPIFWSCLSADKYHEAEMMNQSPAGIYFESGCACEPGAVIRIHNGNGTKTAQKDEENEQWHAQVLWRKETETPQRFGMGARYFLQTCTLCGRLLVPNQFRVKDEFTYLCFDCGDKISALPEGALKSGIEHYLTGNII